MPHAYEVTFDTRGRSGTVTYREPEGAVPLYWEFGGGDVVATISGPAPERWDAAYPWCAGRRPEILERVAEETIRRRAPGCRYTIDAARSTISILERSPAEDG